MQGALEVEKGAFANYEKFAIRQICNIAVFAGHAIIWRKELRDRYNYFQKKDKVGTACKH